RVGLLLGERAAEEPDPDEVSALSAEDEVVEEEADVVHGEEAPERQLEPRRREEEPPPPRGHELRQDDARAGDREEPERAGLGEARERRPREAPREPNPREERGGEDELHRDQEPLAGRAQDGPLPS